MLCQPAQASGIRHACICPDSSVCSHMPVIVSFLPCAVLLSSGCQPLLISTAAKCLQARQIILMAFGEGKAAAVAQAVEGPVSDQVGCAWLHRTACRVL